MAVLDIVMIGSDEEDILHRPTQRVRDFGPTLHALLDNMAETMHQASGVGLAAPQVGVGQRITVIEYPEDEDDPENTLRRYELINPKIIKLRGSEEGQEGCLSIPDVRGDVERPPQLRLRYLNEDFEENEAIFTGLNARVIQHEYDHIEGVLFVEHLKPIRRRRIQRKLDNIKKGKVSVEYNMKFAMRK